MDKRSISKRTQFLVAGMRIDFQVWKSRYTCDLGSSLILCRANQLGRLGYANVSDVPEESFARACPRVYS